MIADLGYVALVLAFGAAIYSAVAAWYGKKKDEWRWIESSRNATILTFPLVFTACLMLVISLVQGDFSLEYVWRVSSVDMPTYLKVTALWGGQAGSLLFWNLLLSIFTAAVMFRKWGEQKELMPYALIVASFTQIFFLGISAFVESAFVRLDVIPVNGNGLNPLLRHPGMIIHPPMLYLGFTGFVVPYTFAMAALMAGKLDDAWIRTTRRWTMVAWLFLSLGLILGGRWAYDVLGWGGYWGWDPVENASLMPWLSGTAFLHSVMIQEKKEMFKTWNIFLVVLTYCLVVLGTFVVRSGVISSVHSFAQSAIGPFFFAFITLMFGFSAYWITKRREQLTSKNTLTSFFSREAAFLYNNFLIIAILAIVFLFTYYPIFSELVTNEKGFVGPEVYETALAPLFAALMLLMGVAPLTFWTYDSLKHVGVFSKWPALVTTLIVVGLAVVGVNGIGAMVGVWVVTFSLILTLIEFQKGVQARVKKGEVVWAAFNNLIARNRRRYGGYLIHLGVFIMGYGIIGVELFQQQTQIRLQQGESVSLGNYEMVFNGVQRFPGADDLIITEATADVYENGRFIKTITPRDELYTRTGQPMTIPDARYGFGEDFYVILVNWEPTSADAATFRVYLNPLINWVWAGGIIFMIGTLVAIWTESVPERAAARVRKPVPASG